jgi:hypothetical protein
MVREWGDLAARNVDCEYSRSQSLSRDSVQKRHSLQNALFPHDLLPLPVFLSPRSTCIAVSSGLKTIEHLLSSTFFVQNSKQFFLLSAHITVLQTRKAFMSNSNIGGKLFFETKASVVLPDSTVGIF